MKIGELAQLTNTQPETIRYYEREGLLPPAARTDSNYRVYLESHVLRLSFIRHCRGLDMTLDEIRTLLHYKDNPQENCGAVDTLLDEHIGHVEQRIEELSRLQAELHELREQCRHDSNAQACGILSGLNEVARRTPKVVAASAGPVPGTHRGGVAGVSRSGSNGSARTKSR